MNVDVYHGCSEWSAERILEHGLTPYRRTGRVYVTSSQQRAGFFAAMWTSHFAHKHRGPLRGALICFRLPAGQLLRNVDDWEARDEFVVRGTVPASAIQWRRTMEMPELDPARPEIRRANRKVQRLLETGSGGPGCPAGCRGDRPKYRTITEVALSVATPHARRSSRHGLAHWGRVAQLGTYLTAREPRADPEVVRLFAMLHDTQRLNDGRDPEHGRRAAGVALEHEACSLLDTDQLGKLARSIAEHADGQRSDDPTIGACWDADRLDLWRLGRRPLVRYLSTATARDPETIKFARDLQDGDHDAWAAACFEMYAPVVGHRLPG